MRNVRDVMQLWPTIAAMSRDLEIKPPALYSMWNRQRIPPRYWPAVIEAARRKGHAEVSPELLMRLHAKAGEPALAQSEEYPAGLAPPSTTGSARDGFSHPRVMLPGGEEGGHFSRFRASREARFASLEQIDEHIAALREEWVP